MSPHFPICILCQQYNDVSLLMRYATRSLSRSSARCVYRRDWAAALRNERRCYFHYRRCGRKQSAAGFQINLAGALALVAADFHLLRISIDTQAKVDLCDSSRGGTSRCKKAVQAGDHDGGVQVQTGSSRYSGGNGGVVHDYLWSLV